VCAIGCVDHKGCRHLASATVRTAVRAKAARADLEPDNISVLVAGGSGVRLVGTYNQSPTVPSRLFYLPLYL
jgi:hypothetical protein